MDRKSHPKHHPFFTKSKPYVDNYLKGTPKFIGYDPYTPLNSGLSQPLYDVYGDINFSLPLDMYPPVKDIHRQVILHHRQGDPQDFTGYKNFKVYGSAVPSSHPWYHK